MKLRTELSRLQGPHRRRVAFRLWVWTGSIEAGRRRAGVKAVALVVAGVLLSGGCTTEPGARLERCEDIEMVAANLEGNLGGRENPDAVMEVIGRYQDEHADTYGGRWVDRDNRLVVVAFTNDTDSHREAIEELLPTSNNVTIEVVQVSYSRAKLEATAQEVKAVVSGRDFAGSLHTGILIRLNRVSLDLLNPPEGALDELAELVSDPAAVCVSVSYTPQAPEGPLQVIPDLDAEDPLVTCIGIAPVRYSRWIDPPSIDHVDHPAVDALRAELEAPGPEPLPLGDWVVISIGDTQATFAALFPDGMGHAKFRGGGDRWRLGSYGLGPPCEPTVVLPEGLNRVVTNLDPDSLPGPDSTTIDLLVTEAACANGREMGDALQGPQVVETETAVLVAFAATPLADREVDCPGNPYSPISVELSQPLANRTIYDGLYVPPKPLLPNVGAP